MNETNWRYQLSAMWNHGNWAIEANANNLFMMKSLFSLRWRYLHQTNWWKESIEDNTYFSRSTRYVL